MRVAPRFGTVPERGIAVHWLDRAPNVVNAFRDGHQPQETFEDGLVVNAILVNVIFENCYVTDDEKVRA